MQLAGVFQNFIKSHRLENSNLLLLVSGGVDSMTMLDVAVQVHKPEKIHVLYFHHQTRSENDQEWELIESVCERHGVKFRGEKLDKIDQNQEEKWRNLRKEFSTKYAQKHEISHILTAHHATDLIETMIFRLTKGCGVSGLSPFDTSTKPFWQTPKSELIAYAEQNDLEWMEDPTNAENDHERNLIRNEVLPVLRQITPNLEKVFVNESKIFGDTADYMAQQVAAIPLGKGGVTLQEFRKLHPILQTELLRSLCDRSPSMSEMEDFLRWITNKPQGGSQKELGGTQFQVRDKCLVWVTA